MNNDSRIHISISAVTITKNEEKNIGRWLQSVKQYADEIIVVDTGSTDYTVAIAESAGAKIAHFTWINDFAAAKNYALSLCSGHWIAFLDADEYFDKSDAGRIRDILARSTPDPRIVGIITPLLNIDHDDHDRLISITHQVRLFRRLPDIRYLGAIHEALDGMKIKNRILRMDESVRILHTGYSSKLTRQKVTRNLEILNSEISRRGHKSGDYSYLADCYYGLKDYEKAIEYADKHIRSGEVLVGDETGTYAIIINSRLILKHPLEIVMKDVQRGIDAFPDSALFHFLAGIAHFRSLDFITAAKWFDDGLSLITTIENKLRKDPVAMMTGANNGKTLLHQVYAYRGLIYRLSGDYEKAFLFHLEGLKLYRYDRASLYTALRIPAELDWPAVDVIQLLNTIYDDTDGPVLLDALEPLQNQYKNMAQIYAYYAAKSNQSNISPLTLMAMGNYSSVAESAADAMKHSAVMLILSSLLTGKSFTKNHAYLLIIPELKEAWAALEQGAPISSLPKENPEVSKLIELIETYKQRQS